MTSQDTKWSQNRPTSLPACKPSPRAERSAKPQSQDYHAVTLLPSLSGSISAYQLARRGDVTVHTRVESRRSFARCQLPGSHAVTRIQCPAMGASSAIAYLWSWKVLCALKHSLVGVLSIAVSFLIHLSFSFLLKSAGIPPPFRPVWIQKSTLSTQTPTRASQSLWQMRSAMEASTRRSSSTPMMPTRL